MPSEEEEEVASSQGAFDPVTGKINWDCPCLGGMAYGPCGMQFREAFSCFVFSEQEPKGIDCVEKFKAMQDCFRENPDVYGEGTYHFFASAGLLWLPPSNRNHEGRG
jgi:mitochondrial intermembrane space import and assembly protein 40